MLISKTFSITLERLIVMSKNMEGTENQSSTILIREETSRNSDMSACSQFMRVMALRSIYAACDVLLTRTACRGAKVMKPCVKIQRDLESYLSHWDP